MNKAGEKPTYYVYIVSNPAGITYIGVTNDIFRRMQEHKSEALPGFSRTNKTNKLVYYEEFQYINDAIEREKQIKTWRKEKKRNLIKSVNPKWKDLSEDWFEPAMNLKASRVRNSSSGSAAKGGANRPRSE
jgi:putative endonuclease